MSESKGVMKIPFAEMKVYQNNSIVSRKPNLSIFYNKGASI